MEETDVIEIGTKEFSFTVLNINPQRDLLALTMNINGLSFERWSHLFEQLKAYL